MKNFVVSILLFLGLALTSQVQAYTEGVEYKVVSQPTQTGDKIEVLEFFWYGCPHCYTLEPHMQKWSKTKPDNVELVRIPTVFRPEWKVHARSYYALEMMGVIEEMHLKIFDYMHKKRKPLNKLNEMAAFLETQKVDKAEFLKAYNSFSVETKVRKAIKLLKDYNVRGVPAVVVNGKSYITGKSAGSYDKLIDIVNHLIKKETAAQAK